MPSRERILVVDDHVEMARLLGDQLHDAGFEAVLAEGGAEAVAKLRASVFDLVLTDLRMEKVDGLDVLAAARAADPSLPVIVMTAFGGVDSAIEAMKKGAYHYLTKPFRLDEVLMFVRRALEDRRLRAENQTLRRERRRDEGGLGALTGRSPPMRALFDLVEKVAQSHVPVLVRGESGVGKELVARAIHHLGPRKDAAFVAVNCTALPAALLESELFGHVKGAFTGATTARRGLFVEADGGTLFLDEIGDMPADLQARLLRVLEDGEVRAVGADGSRKVDVRIVAATHQDLEARVKDGRFRKDLFYRLDVAPVRVPPLRERREDIPLLVERFLEAARARHPQAAVKAFSPEVVSALSRMPWPGNVRELENLVQRLVIFTGKEQVEVADLQRHGATGEEDAAGFIAARQDIIPLRQLENDYIAWVVARCGGNKTKAAELLGIDVSTIHRRERERG